MKIPISLTALLALAGLSQAVSISVNFAEDNGNPNQLILSTTAAGVNDSTNWNNVLGPNGTEGVLLDSNGDVSAASVTWSNGGGSWGDGQANTDADAGVGNAQLRRGYLDDNGTPPPAFTLTGIPYANYSLVLYYSTDSTPDANAQYQGATANGAFAIPDPLVEGGDNRYGGNPDFDSTNTLTFGNLSGDLNLQMDARNTNGEGRATISGFEITQVPEPTTPLIAGLAGMVMLLRRRRN